MRGPLGETRQMQTRLRALARFVQQGPYRAKQRTAMLSHPSVGAASVLGARHTRTGTVQARRPP